MNNKNSANFAVMVPGDKNSFLKIVPCAQSKYSTPQDNMPARMKANLGTKGTRVGLSNPLVQFMNLYVSSIEDEIRSAFEL